MKKLTAHIVRRIEWGVQVGLADGRETALVDYFADSKKRTIYLQKGGTPALEEFLKGRLDELRDLLDAARPLWPRPSFTLAFGANQPAATTKTATTMTPQDLDFGEASAPAPTAKARNGAAPAAPTADAAASAGPVIALYTDGGASPNPGAGACAWLIRVPGEADREGARFAAATTNNRMELQAVIEGLQRIAPSARVSVHCDSKYVQQGISSWIKGWKRKGWKTAKGTDVLNRDLWERLDAISAGRRIDWLWVRGHAGHADNERCDELVGLARRSRRDIG